MKFIFLLIPFFLFARINPFIPVLSPGEGNFTTPSFFKKVEVRLPNDARILKKVIFVYETLESDIKQKEVKINKNIDFHYPVAISQKKEKFQIKAIHFPVCDIYIKNYKIFIKTKNTLIRDFFLAEPFRLVLDFKSKSVNFLTIAKILRNSFVKKIVLGAHRGFYRIVIYFDAKYAYKIKKDIKGILIELK